MVVPKFARPLLVVACVSMAAAPASAAVASSRPSLTPGALGSHLTVTLGLCQHLGVGNFGELRVVRSHPFNPERFSFPARTVGTSVAKNETLAAVICALPVAPKGLQCPADFGPIYTLTFDYYSTNGLVGTLIKPVHFDPSGCSFVTGAGPTRRSTPGFISALGAALRLPHATRTTFEGTFLNG